MLPYGSLTRRGQLRRLRSLALAATAEYGVTGRLSLVADSFNVAFRLRSRDGESYLLRVAPALRIHPLGAERAEAEWLSALHRDTGLAVAQVIKRSEAITTRVSAPGVPEPRECTLFTWVPGRRISDRLTPPIAHRSGTLLALLHAHASGWTDPSPDSAPLADRVLYFDVETRFDRLGRHRSLFVEACDRAQDTIDRLWADPAHPPHLLHGDLTPDNLVIGPRGLLPIDFQDLVTGLEVQDVAISLFPLVRRENSRALTDAFRAGYQALRTWPVDNEATLQALWAARRLLMANLALNLAKPGLDDYIEVMAAGLAAWMST